MKGSFFDITSLKRDARKILNFGVDREAINVNTCQG
jgi:hypothetical protein